MSAVWGLLLCLILGTASATSLRSAQQAVIEARERALQKNVRSVEPPNDENAVSFDSEVELRVTSRELDRLLQQVDKIANIADDRDRLPVEVESLLQRNQDELRKVKRKIADLAAEMSEEEGCALPGAGGDSQSNGSDSQNGEGGAGHHNNNNGESHGPHGNPAGDSEHRGSDDAENHSSENEYQGNSHAGSGDSQHDSTEYQGHESQGAGESEYQGSQGGHGTQAGSHGADDDDHEYQGGKPISDGNNAEDQSSEYQGQSGHGSNPSSQGSGAHDDSSSEYQGSSQGSHAGTDSSSEYQGHNGGKHNEGSNDEDAGEGASGGPNHPNSPGHGEEDGVYQGSEPKDGGQGGKDQGGQGGKDQGGHGGKDQGSHHDSDASDSHEYQGGEHGQHGGKHGEQGGQGWQDYQGDEGANHEYQGHHGGSGGQGGHEGSGGHGGSGNQGNQGNHGPKDHGGDSSPEYQGQGHHGGQDAPGKHEYQGTSHDEEEDADALDGTIPHVPTEVVPATPIPAHGALVELKLASDYEVVLATMGVKEFGKAILEDVATALHVAPSRFSLVSLNRQIVKLSFLILPAQDGSNELPSSALAADLESQQLNPESQLLIGEYSSLIKKVEITQGPGAASPTPAPHAPIAPAEVAF